jgi:hypothetical protein
MQPATGRFWTQDSFEGINSEPLSLHKYTYAHSDPVNRIDPSGHIDVDLAELNATFGVGEILASEASITLAPFAGETSLVAATGASTEIVAGSVAADGILPFAISSNFAGISAFVLSAIAGTIAANSSSDTGNEDRDNERTVYRVIRPDENPSIGLFAKDVSASYTPEGHILNGSRPNFRSQYISTTAKLSVAEQWAARTGNRIVAIDLDNVTSNVIDLSTEAGRSAYLKGITAKNFAKASAEVLIEKYVPPVAISPIY